MKRTNIIFAVLLLFMVSGYIFLKWRMHRIDATRAKELFQTAITHDSDQEKKAEVLEQFRELFELNFPPNTKLLFACVTKGDFELPYVCSAKVQINKEELDAFIEEINKHSQIDKHAVNDTLNKGLIGDFYLDYYSPDNVWQVKKVKSKEVYTIIYNTNLGIPIITILIDLDNPDYPIVYFGYARV
jgi:hypothetical protein